MIKSCEDILITQRMLHPLPKDYVSKGISLPLKLIERNNMLPLAGMLFNVVSGLVMDKAQSLAKDHVEKMIDDVLPDEAKEELDRIIKEDPEHHFESATEALVGAAEDVISIIASKSSLYCAAPLPPLLVGSVGVVHAAVPGILALPYVPFAFT